MVDSGGEVTLCLDDNGNSTECKALIRCLYHMTLFNSHNWPMRDALGIAPRYRKKAKI